MLCCCVRYFLSFLLLFFKKGIWSVKFTRYTITSTNTKKVKKKFLFSHFFNFINVHSIKLLFFSNFSFFPFFFLLKSLVCIIFLLFFFLYFSLVFYFFNIFKKNLFRDPSFFFLIHSFIFSLFFSFRVDKTCFFFPSFLCKICILDYSHIYTHSKIHKLIL